MVVSAEQFVTDDSYTVALWQIKCMIQGFFYRYLSLIISHCLIGHTAGDLLRIHQIYGSDD